MTDRSDPHRDLAGVLHDVSNALTVLLGWVGEARADSASAEQVAYALSVVEQRARIARDLARQAIGGARIDEQRAVGGVVRGVADQLRVEAQRRSVQFELSGEDETALVPASRDLEQVLTNLALNAVAHAPAGSVVHLRVRADDSACTVEVADEGPGIAKERHESVFRGDSLRPGGIGVGLRHARALARAAGGDVTLAGGGSSDSELDLGAVAVAAGGACFRVSWPRTDAVPRPPVSTARLGDLAGVRVLVVEDDEAVSQLLEAALEARGAEVLLARTAVAMAKVAAEAAADPTRPPFDAALIDLSPIAKDVTGALGMLQRLAPKALVVLVTGNADAVPAAPETAAVELVRKPFEVREVLAVVGAGVRARRAPLVVETPPAEDA